jgi:hypothetical protein
MARTCGPCGDVRRNELDRRLLEKELTGESFRRISEDFGYSETSLRRHLSEHLSISLASVHEAMDQAREEALAKVKAEELKAIINEAKEGIVCRLEACSNFFDQLKILRERAGVALEVAESTADTKVVLQAIRELRETIRIWAELEGKLQAQQINVTVDIYHSLEWQEVGRALAEILGPESPELRCRVAERLYALAEAHK